MRILIAGSLLASLTIGCVEKSKKSVKVGAASQEAKTDNDSNSISLPIKTPATQKPVTKFPNCGSNITEDRIAELIASRQDLDPDYHVFVSAHEYYNSYKRTISQADLTNLTMCRFGISKIVNSQTRVTDKIIHPLQIGECPVLYAIDTRKYWGKTIANTDGEYKLIDDLNRARNMKRAMTEVREARFASPNDSSKSIDSFHQRKGYVAGVGGQPGYVSCDQFIYSMSQTPIYQYQMELPVNSNELLKQLKINLPSGEVKGDFEDYLFTFTSKENAITNTPRLSMCTSLDYKQTYAGHSLPGGYYCQSTEDGEPHAEYAGRTDPKKVRDFAVVQNPNPKFSGGGHMDSRQELLYDPPSKLPNGEIIFSLPNGYQGYYLTFNSFDRRNYANPAVILDPLRHEKNVPRTGSVNTGSSCHGCHSRGLKRPKNDLLVYLKDNPTAFAPDLMERYMKIYNNISKRDRFYGEADQRFRKILKETFQGMNPGFTDSETEKYLDGEPILTMTYITMEKYDYKFFWPTLVTKYVTDSTNIFENCLDCSNFPQDSFSYR